MRAVAQEDDRKAAAVIRDSAMELFAARGTAGVTVRQIARVAGVSPSLVIHHFGSKDGLKHAVDRRVVQFVIGELEDMARAGDDGAGANFAELWAGRLRNEGTLVEYVSRLLVEGGEAAEALFDRLLGAAQAGVRAMTAANVARPSGDERARAAFLLSNDLAMVLLRGHIGRALGVDPLSRQGLTRWVDVVMDVYTNGLFMGDQRAVHGRS